MNVLVIFFNRSSQIGSHFAFGITARTALSPARFVTTLGSLTVMAVRITVVTKSATRTFVGVADHVMMKVVKVQ